MKLQYDKNNHVKPLLVRLLQTTHQRSLSEYNHFHKLVIYEGAAVKAERKTNKHATSVSSYKAVPIK